MVFSSLTFLCIFLPVTFVLYCLAPTIRVKNILLIIASLLFYAYGEPVYIILMLGSTVFNYIFGCLIDKCSTQTHRKKLLLVVAVLLNLSLLVIYKYMDMIVSTVNYITGLKISEPGLTMPIGISFYTFQAMSYVIDVYRDKVKAQKNYFKVLLYISFFPQLIAGPIVKYYDIEQQISNRRMDVTEIAEGLRRFIIGLSKKVLISNGVAAVADALFALNLSEINVFSAWIAAVAYMLQIYYDFSGYSDMAIGLAHMFGFNLLENFRYPYSSASVQEFWRKWHISLSTWFKEYVYIPLGGNRKGRARTWLNRWIVFFLTGLWHGANWTFVIWGLYHGFFLFIEDLLKNKKPVKIIGNLYTLLVVCVGFVIFRADTIAQGFGMVAKMFTGWQLDYTHMSMGLQQCTPLFLFTVVIGIIGQFPWLQKLKEKTVGRGVNALSYVVSVLLLVLCVLNLSGGTYNPFIYFRF